MDDEETSNQQENTGSDSSENDDTTTDSEPNDDVQAPQSDWIKKNIDDDLNER
jgi:hypothetical protein